MAQLRPTFSESWYRVVGLKARLRGSTQISRQHYRGDRWYVVRDPAGNQYHRLSSAAYRFVGLLDGSRTVGEAWDLVGGQLADDAPTQPEVIQILTQLHAANLLEADVTADSGVLLRRQKQLQKRQFQSRLMNVLFPRIPLWDPDRFLKLWMPVMRFFLSGFGAMLWIAVVIAAVVALVPHWSDLKVAAAHAIDKESNSVNYIYLFLTFCIVKLIHELGHAFTCRRFGGEVHELGIMFLVFIPAPYVDASSAWALPSRWHRMLVGAGGMIFELFIAAILAFVWVQTRNGAYQLVSQLAYNAMLIASVSTVVFNANPLLRYDGYYILSDFLEIPNLSQKAKDYTLGLIKRHVFGVKSSLPLPPFGQRIWLFFYSIASGIYRVMVGLTIIFVVGGQVPVLGYLMAAGGVVTWLIMPVWKIIQYLLLDPELHRKRFRACFFVGTVATILFVTIGLIQFPTYYYATGIVEPASELKSFINSRATGFIKEVRVKSGDVVKKGDVLIVLRNEEAEIELTRQKVELEKMMIQMKSARALGSSEVTAYEELVSHGESNVALAQKQVDELVLTSPRDGVVICNELDDIQDRYVRMGEAMNITIAKTETLHIFALLEQKDSSLPQEERPIDLEIRLAGDRGNVIKNTKEAPDRLSIVRWSPGGSTEVRPSLTNAGGEEAIPDPRDPSKKKLQQEHFPVVLALKNNGNILPGQKAYVRMEMHKRPLIVQWSRKFWQMIQQQNLSNKWQ